MMPERRGLPFRGRVDLPTDVPITHPLGSIRREEGACRDQALHLNHLPKIKIRYKTNGFEPILAVSLRRKGCVSTIEGLYIFLYVY
jgi:hypothetical protein